MPEALCLIPNTGRKESKKEEEKKEGEKRRK
jgi:hypothetical protein